MPGSTNVVDDARQLMEKRLADLGEESRRLERALAELGGKSARRSPGRPRGAAATKSKRSSKPRTPQTPKQ